MTSLIFVLLGLYLPGIIAELADGPVTLLAGAAALILLTVILVRVAWVVAWVFATVYFPVPPSHGPRQVKAELDPPWKRGAVVAWAGIRGTDALVLALALPFTIASGRPFPGRAAITFLTFTVAVATLLIEGLSLQTLIRHIGLQNDVRDEREEALALAAADTAALESLDAVLKADGSAAGRLDDSGRRPDGEQERDEGARVGRAQTASTAARQFAEHLRWRHAQRAKRFAARAHGVPDPAAEEEAATAQRLRREVVEAQRRAIISLRDRGEIGDAALQRVLHDLDLEDQPLM